MSAPSLCWFRQDLRLSDNPALTAAARGGTVLPFTFLKMKKLAQRLWAPLAAFGYITRSPP